MKNNMRRIISSFLTFTTLFVGSMLLFAPQPAEAAWCYDVEMTRFCFEDDQKDDCLGDGTFTLASVNQNTCYAVAGSAEQWDGTRSDFAVDETNAKTKDGTVACYTTGMGNEWCFPTMEACKDTWGGDFTNCGEKTVDKLYCTTDSSIADMACSPSLQTCKTEGNCTAVDFKDEGLVAAVAAANAINIETGIKLTGRYDYTPLESTFISKDNAKLPSFLQYIFNIGIAVVGMAALVMMTIGGLTYIGSAGNNATAQSAKKMIRDATMGLLLAFFSWLILFVINPDLVGIDENLEKLTAVSGYITDNQGTGALAPAGGASGTQVGAGDTQTGGGATVGSTTLENGTTFAVSGVPIKPTNACSGGICSLDSPVMAKLEDFQDLMGDTTGWWVTEAWPPTRTHSDPCHVAGTCVDISFSQKYGSNTAQTTNAEIQAVVNAAAASGLRAVVEVSDASVKDQLISNGVPASQINVISGITGQVHFSIYNRHIQRSNRTLLH